MVGVGAVDSACDDVAVVLSVGSEPVLAVPSEPVGASDGVVTDVVPPEVVLVVEPDEVALEVVVEPDEVAPLEVASLEVAPLEVELVASFDACDEASPLEVSSSVSIWGIKVS